MAATIDPARRRLVGRERELGELERHLDELRAPRAAVLAISGEPGIGKTRLLAELGARARARGHLVLEGRALEFESEVPFAPFVDALDDHLGRLEARRLARLGGEQLAELAHVFPGLADRPGAAPVALEAERYRLHRAARGLLHALAIPRPLVLTLDDLHWADEGSLELLAHVLRRPPPARLLIAIAFRPRQAPARLIAALDGAARSGAPAHAIELAPLGESQIIQLLADRGLDADAGRAIHAESGGNPFYAEQLARAGPASPAGEAAAPAAVAAAIAREVDALGAPASALLLAAAVIGDPFDGALATAVAELEAGRATALLDELCARDLVRVTDVPGRFAFRHPIVRAALYASAPAGARVAAHARAAAALERRGDPAFARAHHLERCASPGDVAAAETLVQAATHAAARAPATAARWYEAALALHPSGGADVRLELLVALARALAAAGRLEAARERVEEALALMPAESSARRSELTALCAGLDLLLGRHAEAHARLVAALEQLPDRSAPARVALEIELAIQPIYSYRPSADSDQAARSLAAATIEDRALRASVRAALAVRATLLGHISDALRDAAAAAALVDALDDHRLAARLNALHFLGGAEIHLNHYRDGMRHLTRGVALARAAGHGRYLVPMLAHLAVAHATLGQIAAGHEIAEDALDTARLAGPPSLMLWALYYAGLSEIQAGDLHAAHELAREADELAQGLPPGSFTAKARALLATTSLELGDSDRALALLTDSAIAEIRQHEATIRSPFWEALVRTLIALDRRTDAARALDRIDPEVAALDLPMARCHAHRARAHLLLADGDPSRAAQHALLAATDADRVGAVIEAARARTLAGQALAAAGDTDAAIAELERAHRALAACHADGHRDRAARALRQLGRRVPRPGRPAPAAAHNLSEREHQIAQLAADGLTNQQIAGQLHLSTKTVEMHLTRTYGKLGIARRAALARVLADTNPER